MKNSGEIYDVPGLSLKTEILKVGGGPSELLDMIPTFEASFSSGNNGHYSVAIPQLAQQKLLIMDLVAEEDSLKSSFREKNIDNLPSFPVLDYDFPSGYRYLLSVDPMEGRVSRDIYKDQELQKLPCVEKLNANKVISLDEISLITSAPVFQPDGSKVVEVYGFRNMIDIYDLKDETALSIVECGVSTDMETASSRMKSNIIPLTRGMGYPDFFTVIQASYDGGKLFSQSLLFFNWDGEALGKITLASTNVTCADIDLNTSTLYILDSEMDQISAYDISKFLSSITA